MLKKKELESWRTYTIQFQDLFLSYNNQEAQCWCKDRLVDQWDQTASPETDPNIYNSQMISNKGVKAIQQEEG